MSADSMPILPETDPASDRWAIQDSNGGKYVQDVGSEVMFESIRISKCLVNESTDSRCGDKPALKMKIVLAEKKEKSGIPPGLNRAHEDDEDTDIVEDESDSSTELTIVDDANTEEAPPEQEQTRRKSAKDGRKKRKAKDVQETKSHAVKKRREEREAEKRRCEEISKTWENEAIAKRIAMEFSNFRRYRQPTFGESTIRTENESQSETRASRTDVTPKPSTPESPAKGDLTQLKNSVEKSPLRLVDVTVTIPSSENLSNSMRNGSSPILPSQCDADCFELSKSDRKDNFPVSSTPSQGKHHIPIGLPPAPSTLQSTSSASQMSRYPEMKRESPRQSPCGSPEDALVLPDHNKSKVTTIDLANSPEPPSTIVCSASYCPGSPPPTIHIPEPLLIIEKFSPKLNEPNPSELKTRRSPKAHVSNQAEPSSVTKTSPSSQYESPAPLTVEVPLVSSFPTASNRSQPSQTSHSRAPAQNQFSKPVPNSEANQSADRQTKHKTIDLDNTRGQVFNPKFSAFSVDNLTKVDIHSREKRKSPPTDHLNEGQRKDRDFIDSSPAPSREEQAPIRTDEIRKSPKEKVRVVRQNEFEFARPHAAPRKSRLKTSSPPPLSSSGAVPPLCSAPPPGNLDGQTAESKSALIWRYIQHQSGGNTMQTIDSALESVRASSSSFKHDDSKPILCNYLQGQRKHGSPDKIATRAEQRSPGCSTSPDPMARACDPRSLYLTELKKMLVTLQKFSLTISMDVGKSVYHNIYALVSGGCAVEDFVAKTQRATRLALKPYVGPFLTSYLPLLQKEITMKAASLRTTSSRYMRSNPECIIDPMVKPGDPHEVFISEFDIPNKKKTPPQQLSGQNLMVAQPNVRNPAADPFGNARVPPEIHDFEARYRPRLTIQNDLMVIQEMLDHISRMVENTKRALSCLQEESPSSVCQETSSRVLPCCPPIAPAHLASASSSVSRDPTASSARLDNTSRSPPPYSSVSNSSACNSQQKNTSYLQNAILRTRSASNDFPRPSTAALNGLNQTQKDLMFEARNPQVTHAVLPPAADSPPFAMRSPLVASPNAMQKETALSSNSNPPMPVPAMEFSSPDILASRNDPLQKEFNGANIRDNIPVNSDSTSSSFMTSAAAERKNQESVRPKSSTAASKTAGNLRLNSQSMNIGDPECCWNCGRTAQETCSGCKLAKYCGLFCQHRD